MTITARLRDSEPLVQGKDPFREDGAQQVYSINTDQITAVTGVPLAGSYLQLVENQPGGLGVIGLPHLDAGPFLSYGIQWIAFGIIAPIGLGYFVVLPRSGSADGRRRRRRPRTRSPTRRSRPRRSSPTATAGGAEADRDDAPPPACTARDKPHRPCADPRPAAARPSPSVGRISSSCAYCVGPPSRTPSAPANAASTTPALGLGWRAASRRHARTAPTGDPPTTGAHTATSSRGHPRRDDSWRRRRNALQPSRIGHSAATGGRSSRPACWRRGRPAPRAPRRRRPTTAARPAHRRCSRRPTPTPRGSARRRRAPTGRVRTATAAAGGRRRCHRTRAARPSASPVRRSDVPPSATNIAAAVAEAVPAGPAPRDGPLHGHTRHTERAEQRAGMQHPGASAVGVGQPLQSRCAAAEQRHRMATARVAEQQVGEPARPRFRRRGRDDAGANTPAASHKWCTRIHEAGPTATPDPGGRPAQPGGGAAARGERDHAAGLAGRRLRRAREPGGQRQRVQAPVQAGPHHRHLSGRRDDRHRRGPRADPPRGGQGARAWSARQSSSPVSYNAFDPRLQLWVAACLYRYYVDQHEFLYGPLDDDAADAVYRDAKKLGTTLQVREDMWPPDRVAFDEFWKRSLDELRSTRRCASTCTASRRWRSCLRRCGCWPAGSTCSRRRDSCPTNSARTCVCRGAAANSADSSGC